MVLLPLSERSNSGVQPCFDPISVQFRPNSTPVQITDGAAALGYLFSLVEPPAPGIRNLWCTSDGQCYVLVPSSAPSRLSVAVYVRLHT
jgi:hypothetical protein